jgi:SAM-dependent methyltransferase
MQAFHWCPDFARASAEFGRILKPGGVLALIWNLEDRYVVWHLFTW